MPTVLKRGSTGEAVRELQTLLNLLSWALPLVLDGNFGAVTERAVVGAQDRLGLVVDGKAGPQTMTALRQATRPAAANVRPEPDKTAMGGVVPAASPEPGRFPLYAPPPNAGSLKLLDTARPIREVIWHCTATAEGKDYTVNDIRAWHKMRGWSDIGYHYVVYRDGRIMLGRPVGQIGAHCEGHNTGTVGCSYIGGVSADGKTAKDTRTPAQRASMLWLTRELRRRHAGIAKISGHNQYACKACPSFRVPIDALGRA